MMKGSVVEALARVAARLVRLPLVIAGAVAALLVLDAFGVPGALQAARIGVRILLASYLLAGVLNLPSFPRSLRGPATRPMADGLLIDMWTLIALIVGMVAASEGSGAGLL